jgi:hypothetical protein
MTGIDIGAVAESAFAMMEGDAEERAFVEQKAQQVAAAANWFARKKLFLGLIEELDATSELAAELLEAPEFTALMEEAVELFKEELRPSKTGSQPDQQDEAREPGGSSQAVDTSADDLLPEDAFAVIVPVYIGAILERLNEKRIECLEQAAIYALSTHEAHQLAASSWFNAEPKRLRMFRKFMTAHPQYRDALKRIMIADDQFPEIS